MVEEAEIRINPKETSLLVQMLKLRMQGYSYYRIGKELSMHSISVKRRLDRVDRDYSRIKSFIRSIQKVGYFKKKNRERGPSPETQRKAHYSKKAQLSRGIPLAVGSALSTRTVGYRHTGNKVEVDPEQISLAKKVFNTYYNGGNMKKLCRDNHLNDKSIRSMMRNTLYIGKIRLGGDEYSFPQLAIIDEEVWKACQPYGKPAAQIGCSSKFGFIRKAGRLFKDPEKTSEINKVVDLRLMRKSFEEIVNLADVKLTMVWKILNDPLYAGKVLVKGEYVDAGVPEIVPFKKWLKAHNTFKGRSMSVISGEKRRQRSRTRREKLFNRIKSYEGKYTREIRKKFGYKPTTLKRYLRVLKLEGRIEKQNDRWYVKAEGAIEK